MPPPPSPTRHLPTDPSPNSPSSSPEHSTSQVLPGGFLNRMNRISARMMAIQDQQSEAREETPGSHYVDTLPSPFRNLFGPSRRRVIPDLDMNHSSGQNAIAELFDLHSAADLPTRINRGFRPGVREMFTRSSNFEDDAMSSDSRPPPASDDQRTEQDVDNEGDGEDYDEESDFDEDQLFINEDDDEDDDDDVNLAEDDDDDSDFGEDMVFDGQVDTGVFAVSPNANSDNRVSSFLNASRVSQRLLLSSARHNPTNQNTLISPQENPGRIVRSAQSLGIPLRRQNAIRRRHHRHDTTNLKAVASALHEEFKNVILALKKYDSSFGSSPVFCNHRLCETTDLIPSKWKAPHLYGPSILEYRMDMLLESRRSLNLWPSRQARPVQAIKRESKRAWASESKSSNKRRKIRNRPSSQTYASKQTFYAMGDAIDIGHLSRIDKYKILDGLPCAYFANGSIFNLFTGNSSNPAQSSGLDLTFAYVNYKEKVLNGHFTLRYCNMSDQMDFEALRQTVNHFCGMPHSDDTNKNFQTIYGLLEEIFSTLVQEERLQVKSSKRPRVHEIRIPFSGHLVDFDKNDLRYSMDSRSQKTRHTSRLRNDNMKRQLRDWLRIKPFQNFAESHFFNYLTFVERNLRDFGSTSVSEQESILDFAKNIKEYIYGLTKDFESVIEADVPMIRERIQKIHSGSQEGQGRLFLVRESSFLSDWNTKLCESLCEHVSCTDTCLLNLQLNYALFIVKIDSLTASDHIFRACLDLISNTQDRLKFKSKYADLRTQSLPITEKETLFVCSLNRKTGSLEMQNTRISAKKNNWSIRGSQEFSGSRSFELPHFNFPPEYWNPDECTNTSPQSKPSAPDWKSTTVLRGRVKRGSVGTCSYAGESRELDFL